MRPINSGHSGAFIRNPKGTMRKGGQPPTVYQVRVGVDRMPLHICDQVFLYVLRSGGLRAECQHAYQSHPYSEHQPIPFHLVFSFLWNSSNINTKSALQQLSGLQSDEASYEHHGNVFILML